MRITCDVDCNMGYITLMPSRHFSNYKSNLNQYYKDIDLEIPILKGNHLSKKLENMKLMNKTYKRALYGTDADIDSEYSNDIDNDGYITGIELTLKKDKFIQLIQSKAFKIYETSWNKKDFYLVTFDLPDITFNSENVIYPLTNKNDSYLIVSIKECLFPGIETKYRLGLIKALITNRTDLYPIEYLKDPQFILIGRNILDMCFKPQI